MHHQGTSQRGASLIELMVGILIGLLAVLVITQVALFYEGQKRSTTSGSDAQINGALALQSLQRDAQAAGYGAVSGLASVRPGAIDMPAAGCSIRATLNGAAAAEAPTRLAPVVIDEGVDGAPDTLRVLSAGKENFSLPLALMSDTGHAPSDSAFRLRSGINVGNAQGDLMLAVYVSSLGVADCTLFNLNMNGFKQLQRSGAGSETEIGAPFADLPAGTRLFENTVPAGAAGVAVGPRLGHAADATINGKWNGDGATPIFPVNFVVDPTGAVNAYLVNLGQPATFIYRRYSIANGDTLRVRLFSAVDGSASEEDLYPGIANLQAVYGKALGNDPQQVTTWNSADPALDTTTTTGTAINGWSRVVALRIAVVARSQKYEKEVVTPRAPVWHPDGITPSTLKVDGITEWDHYRYKVYQTVVPLRNMLWQS